MKDSYTASELGLILGVSVRAVQRRAVNGNWPANEIPNGKGGGTKKLYGFDGLPQSVQLAIRIWESKQETEPAGTVRAGLKSPPTPLYKRGESGRDHKRGESGRDCERWENGGGGDNLPVPYNGNKQLIDKRAMPLNLDQIKGANARADLVRLYREYCETAGGKWGRIRQSKKTFLREYNRGEIGTYPQLFAILGNVSIQCMERWCLELKRHNNDPLVLADIRGKHRKGSSHISDDQKSILLRCALVPGATCKSEAIRAALVRMREAGMPCALGEAQLRRILNEDEAQRYNIWVGIREGEKAHNEKCVFHVRRDWNRVKVGDILIADGHKLNFEILDPFTGKPKRMTLLGWYDGRSNMPVGWEIMPTENIFCITSALRRALINVGRWPVDKMVAYMDNGRAFRAKYFNSVTDFRSIQISGLYERLGMNTMFAWPYHAESKPIEGFFGIFAELERRIHAAYTGTSIDKKPPRLKRGEKLHKALHDKFFQGYTPTIFEAHELIAAWFDEYSQRKQKEGHLKGKRPIDVFMDGKGPGLTNEQISELKMLMMPMKETWIKRDGIELPGRRGHFYYHPALFGKRIPVLVRHDWNPDSPIYVWDLDGKFICEATLRQHLNPGAKYFGTEAEQEELGKQIEMKRSQEKQTFGVARELLRTEVLPEVVRRIEAGGVAKKDGERGGRGDAEKDCGKVIDLLPWRSEEEKDRINREVEAMHERIRLEEEALAPQREEKAVKDAADKERYKKALLDWMDDRLSSDDRWWMDIYEHTPEYRESRQELEDYRLEEFFKREDSKKEEESDAN